MYLNMKRFLVLLFDFYIALASARVSYDDYKVYRVYVINQEQSDIISSVFNVLNLDVWNHAKNQFDIMSGPSEQGELEQLLTKNGLGYNTMIKNVQALIDATETLPHQTTGKLRYSGRPHTMDWATYHSLEEIYVYIDYIAGSNRKEGIS